MASLVLIVDDNDDTRELYATYMRFAGLRSAAAANGEQGVDKAHQLKPDVIVMDLTMPGMPGLQAIRELKSDDRTSRIPVIVLTADHSEDTKAAAMAVSCDLYLTKPCMPEHLVACIRQVLNSAH